jgi:hypothetical protein
MSLKDGQSELTQEVVLDYKNFFGFDESFPKNNEEPELISKKDNENEIKEENLNKSEKKNINDYKEEININNKLETIITEKNLAEPEIKNYNFVQSNNIKKHHFIFQIVKEANISPKNKPSLGNKRGRPKKSNDRRQHTKFDNYNIEKKIKGVFIKSLISFINIKIDDKSNDLKTLSFEETENLKINMDKKVKDILQNVSKSYDEDYNKKIISTYEPKLKEIFELPMYKIIHHISGSYIDILKGLEEEYLFLKNKKLEEENEEYKKLFNEIEANFLNLIIIKYPINDEITQDNSLNLESNANINYMLSNNDNMVEIEQFSLEMIDSLKNDTVFSKII